MGPAGAIEVPEGLGVRNASMSRFPAKPIAVRTERAAGPGIRGLDAISRPERVA